jgi:hypothetical protein
MRIHFGVGWGVSLPAWFCGGVVVRGSRVGVPCWVFWDGWIAVVVVSRDGVLDRGGGVACLLRVMVCCVGVCACLMSASLFMSML